jgi:hypothetical protein
VVDVLVNVKQRRTESNICCALGSKKACDVTRDTESSNVPDTAALKQYNFINLPQPQYPTRPPPLIFLISLKQSVSSRTEQQGILLIDTQAQAKQQTARLKKVPIGGYIVRDNHYFKSTMLQYHGKQK